jgi:hypothetical protein
MAFTPMGQANVNLAAEALAGAKARVPGVRYATDVDGVELVSIPHAAILTGMSKRTIYGWIERKLVEVRYTPAGHLRVVVESLFRDERA